MLSHCLYVGLRDRGSLILNLRRKRKRLVHLLATGPMQWLPTLLQVAVVFRERSLVELKASLKRAFSVSRGRCNVIATPLLPHPLQITNIQFETISETIFKCKYDKSANRIG